ncbi:MAG: hypothetical protein N2489_10170 [Clostridia bacterium]|nr:hypothetical protein [Clostridia bacterium]
MSNNKTILKDSLVFSCFLVALILKYVYFGFRYYPVIDDWIQYGTYPLIPDAWQNVIVKAGYHGTRPLAALADIFIWGKFWDNMAIVFFIMTMLHFISGCLLYKTFEDNQVPVGIAFLIVYGLLPLGSEATYWISASSRLVVGIFFMSASVYALTRFLQTESRRERSVYLIVFLICHLISMGFYEQIILLSFFSAFLIVLANLKNSNNKWNLLLPFISFALISIYYFSFSKIGQVASRGQLIRGNFLEHINYVLRGIARVFTKANFPLLANGFARGFKILIGEAPLFLLPIIVISAVTAIIAINRSNKDICKYFYWRIFIGFSLFFVPFILYFILEQAWISNRNAFPSFIGIALIVDTLINALLRYRGGRYIITIPVFAMAFIFLVANVSELSDYKSISQIDQKICANLAAQSQGTGLLEGKKPALVLNTKPYYIEQNMYYHEHIQNVTESDWAFTGATRAVARNIKIKRVVPVRVGQELKDINELIKTHIVFGLEDGFNVVKLNALCKDKNTVILIKENGDVFGEVRDNRFALNTSN